MSVRSKFSGIHPSTILVKTLLILCIALLSVTLFLNNLTFGWDRQINCFYFYFLTSSAILIFGILMLLTGRMCVNKLDLIFLIFITYILINGGLGTATYYYLDDHYLTLFCLSFLYFVFKDLLRHVSPKIFFYTIAILGLVNASYGLLQFAKLLESNNPAFSITGFFSNPGPFAAYLSVTLPFSISCWSTGNKFVRNISPGIVLVIVFAIVVSASRSALLATVVSLLLCMKYFRPWEKIKNILKYKKTIIYAFIPIGIVFLILLYQKTDSILGRLLIWRVSLNMISENGLFGLGLGQFEIQYLDYQALYFSTHPITDEFSRVAGVTYYAFNEWIQIVSESGLCGLILFTLLIYTVLSARVKISEAGIAKVCIAAVLTLGLFFYPLKILAVQLTFIFSLAVISFFAEDESLLKGKWLYPFVVRLLALVLVTINIFFIINLSIRYKAVQEWKQAYTINLFDNVQGLSQYEKLMPVLGYNGEFLFNYGALLMEAGRYHKSVAILKKAKTRFNHIDLHLYLGNAYKAMREFKNAEQCYAYASHMIPSRFYPKYLQALLYRDMNDTVKARRMAGEIIDMKAKVPSQTIDAIKLEMRTILMH